MNFCNLEALRYYDDLAMLLYLTECILQAVFVCTSPDDNVNYLRPAIQQKDGSNFSFQCQVSEFPGCLFPVPFPPLQLVIQLPFPIIE